MYVPNVHVLLLIISSPQLSSFINHSESLGSKAKRVMSTEDLLSILLEINSQKQLLVNEQVYVLDCNSGCLPELLENQETLDPVFTNLSDLETQINVQ